MSNIWTDRWNERYSNEAYAYGQEPNDFLKQELEKAKAEIERLEGLNKTHEEHHLTLSKELTQLSERLKTVQKELEEEKKKKKTDIYGE